MSPTALASEIELLFSSFGALAEVNLFRAWAGAKHSKVCRHVLLGLAELLDWAGTIRSACCANGASFNQDGRNPHLCYSFCGWFRDVAVMQTSQLVHTRCWQKHVVLAGGLADT